MADFDSIDASEVYEVLYSETRAEAEKECREIADIFRVGLITAIRVLLGYISGGLSVSNRFQPGEVSANANLITFDSVPLEEEASDYSMGMISSVVSTGSVQDLFTFRYNIKFSGKMLYRPGLFKGTRMVSKSRADIVETLSFGFDEGPKGSGPFGYWTARNRTRKYLTQAWAVRDPDWVVRDYIQTFKKQYPQVTIDDPWGFGSI